METPDETADSRTSPRPGVRASTSCPLDELALILEGKTVASLGPVFDHLDRCRPCRVVVTDLASDLDAGRTICDGRYRVGRAIAVGGMGVVHEAWDTRLRRRVAVKRTASATQAHDGHEAQHLASLSHPNIVEVFDVQRRRATLAIVMEYVEGSNLRDVIAQGAIDFASRETLCLEVGAGLAHIHDRGIVHGDIKPSNVLVARDGTAKVADFGLAWLGVDPHAAAAGGTLAYLAPERLTGATHGPKSDQYSFCVTACELLTGIPAQPRTSPFLGRLPRRLRSVLRRGLRHDPEQRWGCMDELLSHWPHPRPKRSVVAVGLVGLGIALTGALDSNPPQPPSGRTSSLACDVLSAGLPSPTQERASSQPRAKGDAPQASLLREGISQYRRQWDSLRESTCTPASGIAADHVCLRARQRQFEAFVETGLSPSERPSVQISRLRALQDPSRCLLDPTLPGEASAPPDRAGELETAYRAWDAWDHHRALALAKTVVARAHAHGDEQLTAEASILAGRCAFWLDDRESASQYAEAAYFLAFEQRPDLAYTAALVLARGSGDHTPAQVEHSLRWWRRAESSLQRAGGSPSQWSALYRSRGAIDNRSGRPEDALRWYQRAQRALGPQWQARDEQGLELQRMVTALGCFVTPRDCLPQTQQLLAQTRRLYGGQHPELAIALLVAANTVATSGDTSLAWAEEAYEIVSTLDPDDGFLAANAATALADRYVSMGRIDDAHRILDEAGSSFVPREAQARLAESSARLASQEGDYAAAIAEARRARALLEGAAEVHVFGVWAALTESRALIVTGDFRAALPVAQVVRQAAQRGLSLATVPALLSLAAIELGLGDGEAAAAYLGQASAQLDPDDPRQRGLAKEAGQLGLVLEVRRGGARAQQALRTLRAELSDDPSRRRADTMERLLAPGTTVLPEADERHRPVEP